MTDDRRNNSMRFGFAEVIESITSTWSKRDIALVEELVARSEFGEAMENLVALGAEPGKGFSAAQLGGIKALCAEMGMDMLHLGAVRTSISANPRRGVAI